MVPQLLQEILSYKRPAGSDAEAAFIERFLPFEQDAYGNLWHQVGESPIMWSCHTDTVHHKDGRQHVHLAADGMLRLSKPKRGKCLGADDGAGIWLMLEMIAAGVPGLYAFHREEECGGGGSVYAARRHDFKHIKFAIALDRAGYDSVITHQAHGRCCSDDFANQLSSLLGGVFAPDDTGVFTDTANYTDVIGECTNLSVGYFSQHGPTERLDLAFVMALREKLISVDFLVLEAHREPGEEDDLRLPDWWRETRSAPLRGGDYRDLSMARFIEDHPDFIASILEQMGYDIEALEEAHEDIYRLSYAA